MQVRKSGVVSVTAATQRSLAAVAGYVRPNCFVCGRGIGCKAQPCRWEGLNTTLIKACYRRNPSHELEPLRLCQQACLESPASFAGSRPSTDRLRTGNGKDDSVPEPSNRLSATLPNTRCHAWTTSWSNWSVTKMSVDELFMDRNAHL